MKILRRLLFITLIPVASLGIILSVFLLIPYWVLTGNNAVDDMFKLIGPPWEKLYKN